MSKVEYVVWRCESFHEVRLPASNNKALPACWECVEESFRNKFPMREVRREIEEPSPLAEFDTEEPT